MNYFKVLLCALLAIPTAGFAMEKPSEPLIEIEEVEISKQKQHVPALRLLAAHKAVTSDPYITSQKELPKEAKEYLLEAKIHQKDIAKKQYTKILNQLADQQHSSNVFTRDIAQTQTPADGYINYDYLLERAIRAGNYTFAQMVCKDRMIPGHLQISNPLKQKTVNGIVGQILQSKSCYPKAPWINLLAKNLEHNVDDDILRLAIKNDCEIEGIELLIKHITPAERQSALNNALKAAVLTNNEKAVEFLLEQGADCGSVPYSFEKTSPIHSLFTHFTTHCLADRIRTLLLSYDKQQKFVNKKDDFGSGRTPLMTAIIKQGSIEEIEQLLEHGADIYAKDNQGRTALWHTVKTRFDQQKAELLLSYDGQNHLLYDIDNAGNSLLAYAANYDKWSYQDRRNAVSWILQKDTQKKLPCDSAFHEALAYYNFDVDLIKLLLDNGANIYALNKSGFTCLQQIIAYDTRNGDQTNSIDFPKKRAAIALILEKDCEKKLINAAPGGSKPALLLATNDYCFDVGLVKLLIKHGADIYAKESNTGKTVVHKILECNASNTPNSEKDRTSKIEALREILKDDQKKILVNEPDAQGNPPLLTAILRSEECAKVLLELGANLYAQDNQGRNLLHHLVTNQDALYRDVLNTMYRIDEKFVLQKQQDKDGNTPLMIHLKNPIDQARKYDWVFYLSHNTDLAAKNNNQETVFDIAHKYQQNNESLIQELNRAQERYRNEHYPYENTIRTLSTFGTPGAIAASLLHYYSSKPKEDKK